jgi:thiol-disulfide isomerase/thioredoxin
MKNELQTIEQLNEHITKGDAAMLYFYSDKCAPCVSLRPKVIEMVEKDFPKINLAFVNAEKNPELPAHYNVFANPTLIIFFGGREYRRESKYISISQLSDEIERPYSLIFEN